MNVLITQRHSKNQYGDDIESLESNYYKYFEKKGINLIPISNTTKNLEDYLKLYNINGIILSGGGDIDKNVFLNNKNNFSNVTFRDAIDYKLLNIAVIYNIPVLGICRGMQFINLFFSGKITTKLDHKNEYLNFICPDNHEIEIISNDHFIKSLDNQLNFIVNSFHNYFIRKQDLGINLINFALHKEFSLVEGFYHNKLPIVGIQWHPERETNESLLNIQLMKYFVNRSNFWSKK